MDDAPPVPAVPVAVAAPVEPRMTLREWGQVAAAMAFFIAVVAVGFAPTRRTASDGDPTPHYSLVPDWLTTYGTSVPMRENQPTAATRAGAAAGAQPRPMALPYCHMVGMPETQEWLRAERLRNQETRYFDRDRRERWAARRCVPTEAALLTFDPSLEPYLRPSVFAHLLHGLGQQPTNWTTALVPRVAHVLVDFSGRVYVRVVAWVPARRALHPMLLRVDELAQALTAWHDGLREQLGSVRLDAAPCVCPQHLGIIGSGLHFEPPGDTGDRWRIGVVQKATPSTQDTRRLTSRYKYPAVLGHFPAVADNSLLTAANRTFDYPAMVYFTTYRPAGLADRDFAVRHDEKLDFEWAAPRSRAAPPAVVVEEEEFLEEGEEWEEVDEEEPAPLEASLEPDDPNPPLSHFAAVFDLRTTAAEGRTLVSNTKGDPAVVECYHRCLRLDARMLELLPKAPAAPLQLTADVPVRRRKVKKGAKD